jgi:hypothetical protein
MQNSGAKRLIPAANVHKFFELAEMDIRRLDKPAGVKKQRLDPSFPKVPKYW